MPSMSATHDLPQQWRQHIEDWRNSGLSQQAFCRDRNLSFNQFHYWRKKRNRQIISLIADYLISCSRAARLPVVQWYQQRQYA
jgi:hypothetical protein